MSWSLGRMSRRGAGFRRAPCPIIAIICGRAVVCCRCRSLCSLFCGCSCAVPAPATSLHCLSRSIGSWVYRVFSGLCRSSRWSGCRRFGLRARALFSSGTGLLCVFAVALEPRQPPHRSLLSARRFVESTRTHVYQKPSSCEVYF